MKMTKKQKELKRERDRRYREKKRIAKQKAINENDGRTAKRVKLVKASGLKMKISIKKKKPDIVDPVETRLRVASIALRALAMYLLG